MYYCQVIEEVWQFDLSDVIANIGGNLGLFLGGSVMAGFDFLVDLAAKLARRGKAKK